MRIVHANFLENADCLLCPRLRLFILLKLYARVGKVCLRDSNLKLLILFMIHDTQRIHKLLLCRRKVPHLLVKQAQVIVKAGKIHIVLVEQRLIDRAHLVVKCEGILETPCRAVCICNI